MAVDVGSPGSDDADVDTHGAGDTGEAYWDFDGDHADAVDADDPDGDDNTSAGDEVAHDAPHGEPAEDAAEAYWDLKGIIRMPWTMATRTETTTHRTAEQSMMVRLLGTL